MKRDKPVKDERIGLMHVAGRSDTPIAGTITKRGKVAAKVEESGTVYSAGATSVKSSTKARTEGKPSNGKKKVLADYIIEGKGVIYLLDIKPARVWKDVNSDLTLIDIIRTGVTKRSYDKMVSATGLTATELSNIIHISDRTLRRYAADQILPTEQSNRMVELAALYSRVQKSLNPLTGLMNGWADHSWHLAMSGLRTSWTPR